MAEGEKMDDVIEEEPEIVLPLLSLNILATIRVAQAQHGMRHGDYERYRTYCVRRIRILYKKLKLPQGNRNRFIRRPVEVSTVKEIRHLHIPLMDAERAWTRAMELQKASEEGEAPPKVRHTIKRKFAKASKHAAHLAHLCSKRCESKTYVEAVGYAAMMKGHYYKVLENWPSALQEYQKARKLFEELSKVGEFEQQALFTQVLEELDPSIRFCKYEMDKVGARPGVVDDEVMQSLEVRLKELAVTAETENDATSVSISWCGVEYPVRNERLQAAVLEAQRFESQYKKEKDLEVYDKVVSAYTGVKTLVKQALSAGGGANALGVASDLEGLQTAVLGIFLQHSIERALLQIKHQAALYDKKLLSTLSSTKAKVRPMDLVKLHDAVIGFTGELGELGMKIGGAQGEVLMEGCGAQVAHHQAARCYYVAHSFFVADKHEEAHALFERCLQRADKAIALHEELEEVEHGMIAEMELIKQKAAAFRCAARAECAARTLREERTVTSQMGALNFKTDPSQKKAVEPTKYLADNLDTWEPFIGTGGKGARIFRIPPPLDSMPIRPVVLDTAFNHITPPDLSSRLPTKGQETWAGKIWGMWGSKK
ncbi:hypothetical protein BSKO_13801 [Bryopsis sp. KO-2023]|nr:hypothetical protein BSKO_13801 [Bryopsis sp. KO-2023]